MEFTETEIEMFGKAKDLQAEWKPQRGDWFYKADGLGQGAWVVCVVMGQTLWCAGERMSDPVFKNNLVEFHAPSNYTWIPSIEQLQEMVTSLEYTVTHHSGTALWELAFGQHSLASDNLKLLLLGFLMWEKYHRKWNKTTWKKRVPPTPKTK